MRQWWSWRTWAALGVVVAVILVSVLVLLGRSTDRANEVVLGPSERRVELVASIMAARTSEAFGVVGGVTVGSATLSLDDGREIVIPRDTPGETSCAEFSIPAGCVVLADMLGEGVVWYAIVAADSPNLRTLVLPTLVDMVDGGDTGVLANGWYVPLANGVVRTCAGAPRSPTLRAFITSYASRGIDTVLDLDRDEVVEVICAG